MSNPAVFKEDSRMVAASEMDGVPRRRNLDFFKGIMQGRVQVGNYLGYLPLFYYDFTALLVSFVTPLERIRALLPSHIMHPLRLTPWHGITLFSVFEYRDTDIGPYNEVGICFPITLNKPAPTLTGFLKAISEGMTSYVWKLPVTTEIARDLGIESAGYPKFLAEIQFERHDGWIDCHVAESHSQIFTLSARECPLQEADRMRYYLANVRHDRILWGMASAYLQRMSISRNPSDVRLELENHPIAQELRRLRLGRMIDYRYCPEGQLILNSVLESYDLRGNKPNI